MLTSKTFIKKTKTGKILKIVREHYLRDDITCGVDSCRECDGPSTLEAASTSPSEMCPGEHILCPDTNVILHQVTVISLKTIKYLCRVLYGICYKILFFLF